MVETLFLALSGINTDVTRRIHLGREPLHHEGSAHPVILGCERRTSGLCGMDIVVKALLIVKSMIADNFWRTVR